MGYLSALYRQHSVKTKWPSSMCKVEAGREIPSSRAAWLCSKKKPLSQNFQNSQQGTVRKWEGWKNMSSLQNGQQSYEAIFCTGQGYCTMDSQQQRLPAQGLQGMGPVSIPSGKRDGLFQESTLPRQLSAVNGLWERRDISQWCNYSASCPAQVNNPSSCSNTK